MTEAYIVVCSRGTVSNVEVIDGIETAIMNRKNPMVFNSRGAADNMANYLANLSSEKFFVKPFNSVDSKKFMRK